jgi:hypothetical protein
MLEIKPIHESYLRFKNLYEEDYLQLISQTEDKDELEFYVKVMDIILQQRQRTSMHSTNQ